MGVVKLNRYSYHISYMGDGSELRGHLTIREGVDISHLQEVCGNCKLEDSFMAEVK